jgi:hypothetical protein
LTEKEQEFVTPKRTISLSSGILYGIGCGIGGSVFILLGPAIVNAQSGLLISLILGGILIFITGIFSIYNRILFMDRKYSNIFIFSTSFC